jgi:predicted helicase
VEQASSLLKSEENQQNVYRQDACTTDSKIITKEDIFYYVYAVLYNPKYRQKYELNLEWILDQYKGKKPKDKTIAEKFNNYRFADYKEAVIDLLKRVTTVSVETMKIIEKMDNYVNF